MNEETETIQCQECGQELSSWDEYHPYEFCLKYLEEIGKPVIDLAKEIEDAILYADE